MAIQKKYIITQIEVIEDIICDCCKKSCSVNGDFEFAKITAHWGYHSQKDLETHNTFLCEKCYDEIISKFKIMPKISDSLTDGNL